MSLFNNIFGSSDSKDSASGALKWSALTDISQLDAIVQESQNTPVLLFKHSTRCAVSRMALKNFEREYAIDADTAKPYFLDLLEHRDISNEIASRFNVVHQSPQLLLIKNGEAVYTTSHSDIDADEVKGKIG